MSPETNHSSQPGSEADSKSSHHDPVSDLIVANTTALLRVFDTEAKCTYVNKAWLDFTNCRQDGEHILTENMHTDFTAPYTSNRQLAVTFKQDFSFSYLLLHRTGQYRWICEYSRPIFLPNGIFSGYVSTGVDMHDQKSQAEYFTNKWSSILRSYFHDLRGNIGIVSGAASLLEIMDREQDRTITLEMIQRNTKQMQVLMDQLMEHLAQETT